MKEDIDLYSNPKIVYQKAKSIFGYNIDIKLSTRKDKKYMILDNYKNKWIHFGQMGYQDWTKHKNIMRLINFRNRNAKWLKRDIFTPAFLSYILLW